MVSLNNLSSPQFCEGQCHLIQDISLGIARSHVVQQRCFGCYILNSTVQTSNLQFGIQRSNVWHVNPRRKDAFCIILPCSFTKENYYQAIPEIIATQLS